MWIKTEDGQILKLRDSYRPGFYILPRNDADGLNLFQVLSREEEIAVSWEDWYTNLFDRANQRKLPYVQLQSLRYYQHLLKKLQNDCQVKQLFNTDLLHVQQYLLEGIRLYCIYWIPVKLALVGNNNKSYSGCKPFLLLIFYNPCI